MKINYITVDIDGLNFHKLFYAYLNAKEVLGDNIKEIKILWSPSGRGFHLKIFLNNQIDLIDNIIIRAVLNDDPYRLRYSLKKYFMKVYSAVDVSFDYKNKSYEKPFEIPENLNKDNLDDLAKEYSEKYKDRELKWDWIEIDEDYEVDICHQLGQWAKQKYGWSYKIFRNPYQKSKWLFVIYHEGDERKINTFMSNLARLFSKDD